MSDDEPFDEFYVKLIDIVNSATTWVKSMINLKLLGRFLDL